jgi:hypothetical protein
LIVVQVLDFFCAVVDLLEQRRSAHRPKTTISTTTTIHAATTQGVDGNLAGFLVGRIVPALAP